MSSAAPGQQGEGGLKRPGSARSLAEEDIVRFARSPGRIAFAGSRLGGTVIRVTRGSWCWSEGRHITAVSSRRQFSA